MSQDVIAIFDIGKTNKKILLFDEKVNVVYQEEQKFEEITDDDDFACDDIKAIESWMTDTIRRLTTNRHFNIKALNFATYGASLIYLDSEGKRLTPIYNYLKPMPEDVLTDFYQKYGGIDEFSRVTASPALGMLNSGLQALWLKKKKAGVFDKVKNILHFPQYLSYFFTGIINSEYTSIGCHTAMWNFDKMTYHQWLKHENIQLPEPVSNSVTYDVLVNNTTLKIGIGIHDSSASLVPYLKAGNKQFILVSTGTWCIFMNPFNNESLTNDQLKKDTLCYLSVQQKQVKSSRLFMGHIHDVNTKRLSDYFKVPTDQFKKVKVDETLIDKRMTQNNGNRVFFRKGVPIDFIDSSVDLSAFRSYNEAYHQLIMDLTDLCAESLKLITPFNDQTTEVYVSGGFVKNEIFVRLLAKQMSGKKIYTSEIHNATALGAALAVWETAFGYANPGVDLGLKKFL